MIRALQQGWSDTPTCLRLKLLTNCSQLGATRTPTNSQAARITSHIYTPATSGVGRSTGARVAQLKLPISKDSQGTWLSNVAYQQYVYALALSSEGSTLVGPCEHVLEVKKSKFFTWAWPINGEDEVADLLEQRSDPKASHNCFAWKLSNRSRANDDGEPSGTAGRPILHAIETEGLDGVLVLVVRYFGGTKLGAGGLIRAYGGAARACLQAGDRKVLIPTTLYSLAVPLAVIGSVYSQVAKWQGTIDREEYLPSGGVQLTIRVLASQGNNFSDAIVQATSGQLHPEIVGDSMKVDQ